MFIAVYTSGLRGQRDVLMELNSSERHDMPPPERGKVHCVPLVFSPPPPISILRLQGLHEDRVLVRVVALVVLDFPLDLFRCVLIVVLLISRHGLKEHTGVKRRTVLTKSPPTGFPLSKTDTADHCLGLSIGTEYFDSITIHKLTI